MRVRYLDIASAVIVARGVRAREGVTCAANWVPLGPRLEIEGVGVRIVQDRMAKRFTNRVDVYFWSHKTALKLGKRNLKVKP
jgi:3D (Asp-Asp-Asp) domain-containing protein